MERGRARGTTFSCAQERELRKKCLDVAVGPLIINPLGKPQRLLSTGQRLEQFETTISARKVTFLSKHRGLSFLSNSHLCFESFYEVDPIKEVLAISQRITSN